MGRYEVGLLATLAIVMCSCINDGKKISLEEAMAKWKTNKRHTVEHKKQEVDIDQLEQEKYAKKVEINIAKIREELKTDSPSMRRSILELKLAQDKRATYVLIEVIHVSDYAVLREEAAEALGSIRDKKAVPELINALNDKDYQVKLAAAGALVKMGEIKSALPTLKDIAQKKDQMNWLVDMRIKTKDVWRQEQICREETLPTKAIQILGKMGTQPCMEILYEALKDDNSLIRAEAAYWIISKKHKDQSALKILDEVISNDENDKFIRIFAIHSLSNAPNSITTQMLRKYSGSQEPEIAKEAQQVLRKMKDTHW